ncbi:MAG TPA: undecaprenyldiphospho-muramoylpentapeptide beta-N-acetylglucosaminyltransferase [Balneolaceae bacterium]|nr:undecaprenyldiphospho-muramoylpentapeptide beta-N-acetylglucosaminyltransferase [Balneolaceae bacterium]
MSKNSSNKYRVLMAAGGTGGHVYPAIAIANSLKEIDPEITIKFAGTKTRMEWEAVPRAGYDIFGIWISGFHRRLTLKNILFPVKLFTSLWQSWRIISSFNPDVVISCGGFVAGPVGWVAAQMGVPVFIQEQNSFPGVTNRLLAPKAEIIFTAFRDADYHFPAGKTVLAGNPTRKTLTEVDKNKSYKHFNFSSKKNTLLVLGGSGGARAINEAVAANLDHLHHKLELQIIWQCGPRYYDELHERINMDVYNRLRLVDFLHHIPKAYAAADLVVSRSGALTCSELALTGKASILVPSPNVAGDHQTKNAQSMVESGAARLLKNDDAEALLGKLVEELLNDQQKLKAMQQAALKLAKPNAAEEIANKILATIDTKNRNEL